MGADLYMNKSFKENELKYKPQLDKKIEERNALPKGSDEANKAQEKVGELFNKLYSSEVYYRDSYNHGSLLWSLGLSWWDDVTKYIDDEGDMSPDKAQEFLDVIEGADLKVDKEFLKGAYEEEGWTHDQCVEHFEKRREELISFLQKSVDTKESIGCSV